LQNPAGGEIDSVAGGGTSTEVGGATSAEGGYGTASRTPPPKNFDLTDLPAPC